ncbi:MAG: PAS domain S-box protein, partial [Acidobacteriota bacterium]
MKKRFSTALETATRLRATTCAVMVLWSVLLVLSFAVNWLQEKRNAVESARIEARSSYNKDLVYRRWVTMHGGVYVPPTERTPPNPYLTMVPDRDLETTTGRKLTLINPAYMTRQVHELGQEQYGTRGHITSLKPIRPENAPDVWETGALKAFENGSSEINSLEIIDGEPFMRLMRPMVTEAGCLKCHAFQGYKEGDIRGGISVSVPFTPYLEAAKHQQRLYGMGHLAIGLLGLLALWFGGRALSQTMQALREGNERLELALHGADLGTWDLNLATGRATFNRRWAEMLGYEDCEIRPDLEMWKKMVHPDDYSRVKQATIDHMEGRTGVYESEYRLRHGSGQWVWILDRGRVIERDAEGKPLRLCGTYLDITDRRRSEEAARRRAARRDRETDVVTAVATSIKLTEGSVEELAIELTEAACTALEAGKVSIWLFDESGERLINVDSFDGSTGEHSSGADLSAEELSAIANAAGSAPHVPLPDSRSGSTEGSPEAARGQLPLEAVIRFGAKKLGMLFFHRADGSRQWKDDEITFAYRLADQIALAVSNRERKRAEARLAVSEERFRKLFEESPIGIAFTDRECKIFLTNQAYRDLLGYSEAEFMDLGLTALLHPEDLDSSMALSAKLRAGEIPLLRLEQRFVHKDGGTRWTDTQVVALRDRDGELIHTIAWVQDITERRRTEEALRQAHKHLDSIIEFLPDATFVVDDAGTVVAWNRAIEEMTELPKSEVLGKGNYEYALPFYGHRRPILIDLALHQEIDGDSYDQISRQSEVIYGEVFVPGIFRGKGAYLWGTASVLRDDRGNIVGAIETIRDVTDRKRTEEERLELERAILQTQKLESLGVLAGGIAHDFNNILMAILGNADLALDELSPTSTARENLQDIEQGARRAADLCRQMLAYSGRGKFLVGPIALDVLIEEMAHLLKTSISKKAVLKLSLARDLPKITGDATQIRQIVMNLITNASEALE